MSRSDSNTSKKLASRIFVNNRQATYDYDILDTYEAGLALHGTEIKSIREGNVNLRDAYARPDKGEIWLYGMHVAPYSHGNISNHEPTRPRKLLLHREQIDDLMAQVGRKGLTIVPLRLYLRGRVAKVALALAKGKRKYEKKQALIEREVERDIRRAFNRR